MVENHPHIIPNHLPLARKLPINFSDLFANTCPINPSSPLFLHNGDNLGILLVPQALTGENYSTWSHAMLVALSAKNKMCIIDGSLPKSFILESHYNVWVCCNNLVVL
jgi:hypothetical protein